MREEKRVSWKLNSRIDAKKRWKFRNVENQKRQQRNPFTALFLHPNIFARMMGIQEDSASDFPLDETFLVFTTEEKTLSGNKSDGNIFLIKILPFYLQFDPIQAAAVRLLLFRRAWRVGVGLRQVGIERGDADDCVNDNALIIHNWVQVF